LSLFITTPSLSTLAVLVRNIPHFQHTASTHDSNRPNKAIADAFLARVDAALKPHIADQGFDWEYSVQESSRDLWKINGLVPPLPGSEAEKEWCEKNQAEEFEAEKGGLESL